MKQSGNSILITGATSGIGRALAERFHAAGNTVIISGRRQALLDEIVAAHPGMDGIALDIDDPADIARVAEFLAERHPNLNILINNAGISRVEKIGASRDLSDAEATIVTNLLGPIRMTDALIDRLKGREGATIINVTSGLAFVPLVVAATYSLSKAALRSYTQSLRYALAGQVEVIELAPPGVRTDIFPGQAENESFLLLDDFIDEVMAILGQVPTPEEVLVQAVRFLRDAEAKGRTAEVLAAINSVPRG